MAEHYENILFVVMILAFGGWSTAVGYGYWLPPIKDMGEADAWMARHGRKLRMLAAAHAPDCSRLRCLEVLRAC